MSAPTDSIDVLHVEDDPDFADMAAQFLAREDDRISPRTATTAREGIEHLEGSSIDCIISDYDMPGQDGIEFLETVREDHPDLPFILYTGKGSEVVASEAISSGVTDYLQKESGTEHYELLANKIVSSVQNYRTEQELENLRRQYTKLVEQNLVGIYIIQHGEFIYVNPRLVEIHGYENSDEIVGMSPLELVAPEERDRVQSNLERRMAGDVTEVNYQTVGLRQDGERIDIELHGSRMEHNGEPAIIGAELDITKRKEREDELRQLKEEYETVFKTAQDGIFLFDVENTGSGYEFRLRNLNPAHEETTGLSIEKDRGKTPIELFGEKAGGEVKDNYRRCVEHQEPLSYEEVLKMPSGSDKWHTKLAPVVNDGEVVQLVGVARDITGRW